MSGYIINECEFSIFQNEMCQHLEDMHNSMNNYFPNDQCMTLQNNVGLKDPFKVQDETMDFNVTKYQRYTDMISELTY